MQTPSLQQHLEQHFTQVFSRAATSAAPVPLSSVDPHQPFIRDCAPHELLVRACYPTPGYTGPGGINVVVIGSIEHTNGRRAGDVLSLNGTDTVRLVDIVQPAKVRAR
jgi:hypothetical protein